jgi:tRNA(adenine34) deaminase
MEKNHEYWMQIALDRAKQAMVDGELPIASVLVGGEDELIRASTRTKQMNSIVAHGELFALLELHDKVYAASRPFVIYTTLEPCLMCLGAAIQCEVDVIVFGMKAAPDGGTMFADHIRSNGQKAPKIIGGILEKDSLNLMRQFVKSAAGHPGLPYAQMLVDFYDHQL